VTQLNVIISTLALVRLAAGTRDHRAPVPAAVTWAYEHMDAQVPAAGTGGCTARVPVTGTGDRTLIFTTLQAHCMQRGLA